MSRGWSPAPFTESLPPATLPLHTPAQASLSATEAALIIHYLLGTLKIQTDLNPPHTKSTYKCRGLENACLSVSIQWVSVTSSGDRTCILVKSFSMPQLLSARQGETGSRMHCCCFLQAPSKTQVFFLLFFSLDISIFSVSFARPGGSSPKFPSFLLQGKRPYVHVLKGKAQKVIGYRTQADQSDLFSHAVGSRLLS